MADTRTPRRHNPLRLMRPMTPFGKDLPEDRPSKVCLRNAAHYGTTRRQQESDARQAKLEVGRDLHEKLTWERALKAKEAKRYAAILRTTKMEAAPNEKMAKAAKAAREREEFSREYREALEERRRLEREKKERKAKELAERRTEVYQNRERRLRERALEGQARRTDVKMVF